MTSRPITHGFTLLELMVSLAVGTIILLAATAFLGSSADGYARMGDKVSDARECRVLLSCLSSEFRSAVFHKDMRVDRNGAHGAAHLGFLTLQPADAQADEHQVGDLCAVVYYVKDLIISGRVVRCLMRGCRDSQQTFDALRDNAVDALYAPDDVLDEPIALRVVSFEVEPLVMGDSGRWTNARLPLASSPEAMHIRLVIARPPWAAKLATAADWDHAIAAASGGMGEHTELEVFESVFPFHRHEAR